LVVDACCGILPLTVLYILCAALNDLNPVKVHAKRSAHYIVPFVAAINVCAFSQKVIVRHWLSFNESQ
jgi:hypothetical protein